MLLGNLAPTGRSIEEVFRLKTEAKMSFSEIEQILKSPTFGGQWIRAGDNKWKMQNGLGIAPYDEGYRWVRIEAVAAEK